MSILLSPGSSPDSWYPIELPQLAGLVPQPLASWLGAKTKKASNEELGIQRVVTNGSVKSGIPLCKIQNLG